MTDGTCPVVLAYLPDGRTPVYCMIRTPGHTGHVAHVRRGDGTPESTLEAGGA